MFADLEVKPEDYAGQGGQQVKAKKERPTFPCQSCGGTGVYRAPRVHQEKAHCFPCGGKGFFYQSEGDRLKARAAAAKRKRSKIEVAAEIFNAENPGFVEILLELSGWNSFAADLKAQYDAKGALSAGQVSAALRLHAKALATRAAKAAEKALEDAKRAEVGGTVDLSPIHAMFDKARETGLQKMIYRAEGFKLTPAKADGKNPGAIYVKRNNGEYLGKVVGNTFTASRDATAEDKEILLKIAENPSKVAKEYGMKTGKCCLCGRTLTDKVSIANGIGPICESGWGL